MNIKKLKDSIYGKHQYFTSNKDNPYHSLYFFDKQEGSGRKGLFFTFDGNDYFIQPVFPSVQEYFSDYELREDCFFDETTGVYTNSSGEEVTPINSWDEFLTEYFRERIGRILFEQAPREEYDFDFDSASYEDIAEWAMSYPS